MSDFFEVEEPKANTEVLKQKLHTALKKYDILATESIDWEAEPEYQKICEFLGDYMPVSLIEAVAKTYKKKLLDLTHGIIPQILQDMGVKDLTTEDGKKVSTQDNVSVKVKNKGLFLDWLEANGEGDSLKTSVEFPKGEDLETLEKYLEENGYSYKAAYGIHAQTRDKIIRDRIKEGAPLPPEDTAEIDIFTIAKVK